MDFHNTTTLFEVKPDPRIAFDAAAHQQRDMHRRLVMKEVEPIVDAMDQIQRALATINVVKEELKWLPDSVKEGAKTLTDSLKTALLEVEELKIRAVTTAGDLELKKERLDAEMQRDAANVSARLAAQLDTNSRKEKTEGAKLGVKIATDLAKGVGNGRTTSSKD